MVFNAQSTVSVISGRNTIHTITIQSLFTVPDKGDQSNATLMTTTMKRTMRKEEEVGRRRLRKSLTMIRQNRKGGNRQKRGRGLGKGQGGKWTKTRSRTIGKGHS